jgi:hypothetical protein
MIHDLPAPEISPNFTIDDIHRIREWNYEVLKDATIEEQIDFYKREGAKAETQRKADRAEREVMAV